MVLLCKFCEKKGKIKLNDCEHTFCNQCLAMDIYNYQWFDDFSSEHPLMCPECDCLLNDFDWYHVMDYLVKTKILQRKIVYTCYLDTLWINKLWNIVELGKEYTSRERDNIEDQWTGEIPLYRQLFPELNKVKYVMSGANTYQEHLYTFEKKN